MSKERERYWERGIPTVAQLVDADAAERAKLLARAEKEIATLRQERDAAQEQRDTARRCLGLQGRRRAIDLETTERLTRETLALKRTLDALCECIMWTKPPMKFALPDDRALALIEWILEHGRAPKDNCPNPRCRAPIEDWPVLWFEDEQDVGGLPAGYYCAVCDENITPSKTDEEPDDEKVRERQE